MDNSKDLIPAVCWGKEASDHQTDFTDLVHQNENLWSEYAGARERTTTSAANNSKQATRRRTVSETVTYNKFTQQQETTTLSEKPRRRSYLEELLGFSSQEKPQYPSSTVSSQKTVQQRSIPSGSPLLRSTLTAALARDSTARMIGDTSVTNMFGETQVHFFSAPTLSSYKSII